MYWRPDGLSEASLTIFNAKQYIDLKNGLCVVKEILKGDTFIIFYSGRVHQ